MAQNPTNTPNQPNNQNTTGPSIAAGVGDVKESLKDLLRLNGDYKNQLKDSIKDLSETLKYYEKIEAKLATIERGTINIKEINRQLKDNKEKQYLADKKIADLSQALNKTQKKDADAYSKLLEQRGKKERELESTSMGAKVKRAKIEAQLAKLESNIAAKEDILNIEQLTYVGAKKRQEVQQKTTEGLKKQLEFEKQLQKDIGITGALAGKFAEKLGVGDEYYRRITESARKAREEGKSINFGDKMKALGGAAGSAIKDTLSDPVALVSSMIPIVGGILSGLKAAFDYIVGIEDRTVKFGRALGVSRKEATAIRNEFASINYSNGDLLVNTEKLMDSYTELVGLLGTTNKLTAEQLSTNIKLKDLIGLDEEARKNIAESTTITGQKSEDLTKSVFAQVAGLKAATGIGLSYQQVLSQASKLGGYLGLQFSLYPGKIAKALVTTKTFGLELKQLDGLAGHFLDFEGSISKEIEAQVLTGKQLNLTKAREAFLNNDLVTAASEISKNAGNYLEFGKMNRIQQESISESVGMTRDQLSDMLKTQLYMDRLGTKQNATSAEQLRIAKQRFGSEKEINKALGEGAYQNLTTLSIQEKINAFIEKIKAGFADLITSSGIMDELQQAFDWLSKPEHIKETMFMVRDIAAAIAHAIGIMAKGVAGIARFFYAISHEDKMAVGDFFDTAESNIRGLGGGGTDVGTPMNTAAVADQKAPKTMTADQARQYESFEQKSAAQPPAKLVIAIDGRQVTYAFKNGYYQMMN